MLILALVLLGLAPPPKAYADPGRVPLAISSWCWGTRCGAPIAASTRVTRIKRGSTVHVVLAFTPTQARVAVGGIPVKATRSRNAVSWRAVRPGGMTIRVTGAGGWVTYVGRLVVR